MRLSLCLIAKDEEQFIGACLASVARVVDEMIVVDTGSTDRTIDIAREAGAQVIQTPWDNNFSAARNASLDAATGDWVLILDADEQLVPEAGAAIRQAMTDTRFDCGLLPLHNAKRLDASLAEVVGGDRKGEVVALPRLLRNVDGLRYEGVIHESISAWLVRRGSRVANVPAAIVHYGYVPEVTEARGKAERNTRMLEARCELEPDNPVPRTYLAAEYIHAGRHAEATDAVELAWLAFGRAWDSGARPQVVNLATMRSQIQLSDGRPVDAMKTLGQAGEWGGDHPNLDWIAARCIVTTAQQAGPAGDGALDFAETALRKCLAAHGRALAEEPIPGVTSWLAHLELATVFLLQGKLTEAKIGFDLVLSEHPTNLLARLGQVEVLMEAGRTAEALAQCEPLLQDTNPDGWLLAAVCCDRLGAADDMAGLLTEAQRRAKRDGFGSPRYKAKFDALKCKADLLSGQPEAGPGPYGTLGALMSRQPVAQNEQGNTPTPLIRQVTRRMANIQRVDLLEPLLEPRAEAVVPGIKKVVVDALEELGLHVEDDNEPDFVFIGGAGRSGTTLFRAMLGAHPRLYCGPEIKLLPLICQMRDQWLNQLSADLAEAGVTPSLLDESVKAMVTTLLQGLASDGARIAEKTPHNLLHARYLARLFPRARFVHVIRDGRAVAASLVRQQWLSPGGEPIWYCTDTRSAARYWAAMIQQVRQQVVGIEDRYLEVRYEDLVTEPAAAMKRVLAFLGEAWDDNVLHHEKATVTLSTLESSTAAVSDAVHTDAIDKWRQQLSLQEVADIVDEAGAILRTLAYS